MPTEFWGQWNGGAIAPFNRAGVEATKHLQPGERFRVSLVKPRNYERHKAYFATIAEAFEHWPETHEFQPTDETHLRHWLQIKTGLPGLRNVEVHTIDLTSADTIARDAMIITASAAGKKHPFLRASGNKVAIYWSSSIAYDQLDETGFRPLMSAVFDVIEQEIGVPIATLKSEATMREVSGG